MSVFQGLFALMNRSLRVDDRTLRAHLVRLAFLAITYYLVFETFSSATWMDAPGLVLFGYLSFLNFFAILLGAIGFFSTSITEEKEEMTLGLLKMAGVTGLSLILGKFIPRLIMAMVLLFSQFPFVMFAVTLGGVSLNQLASAYVTLGTFLFAVANVGLLCSVLSRRSHTASAMATVLILLYFFGPVMLLGIVELLVGAHWISKSSSLYLNVAGFYHWMYETTAFFKLTTLQRTGGEPTVIDTQTVSNTLAGLVCFAVAWFSFDTFTREESAGASTRGVTRTRLAARVPGKRRRFTFSPGRVWQRALLWKEFYFHAGGVTYAVGQLIVLASVMAVIIYSQLRYDRGIYWQADAFGLAMASLAVAAIFAASLVVRTFSEEIRAKTLTNLMLLPHNVGGIIAAKLGGILMALVPSLACFVLGMAAVGFFRYADGDSLFPDWDGEVFMFLAWGFLQYVFLLHIAAVISLYLKWGTLPMAIGLLGGAMFLIGVTTGDGEAMLVLIGLMAFMGIPIAQVWIVERMRSAAAE